MKKQLILDAAAQLFAEQGYLRTSTAQLATKAGVAEGTIFRHFKNKEQIFIALVEQLLEKLTHDVYQFLEMQEDQTSIEHISSIIKASYLFASKHNTSLAILLRDAPGQYGSPENTAFDRSKNIYFLLHKHFQDAIEHGQSNNSIRQDLHPSDTACLLASSLVGLMRVVNLKFLQPSDDILKNLILCTTSMLEVKR